MKRKTISILLAAILVFETATPLFASDWFDGYATGSNPKQWTDGGGGKYMYGGDFTYRFKRSTAFKPAIDFRPPGIKAGCNGISISGGFIHFLGLDEIKEQLQSASEGAMMGVVVGIVYSLPGIADAFDKVQKYVRLLQQILSQACQMSAQLTKNWIDSQRQAAKAPGGDLGYENSVGELFNGINGLVGSWNDSNNQGAEKLQKTIRDFLDTSNQTSKVVAAQGLLQCNQTCQIARKNGADKFKLFVSTKKLATDNTYADGTIADLGSIISDADRKRSVEFQMIFIGYYETKNADLPVQLSKDDYATKMTQNLQTGGLPIPKSPFHRGLFYSASNTDGTSAVNTLMNGPADGSSTLKMPKINMRVYYSDGNNTDGSYSDLNYAVLFGPSEEASDNSGYTYPWTGLVNEGVTYLNNVIAGVPTTPTVPNVFPGMNKYVQILRTQFRSNPASAPFVQSMALYLAQKNAVILLQSIIYEAEATLSELSDEDKKTQGEIIVKLQDEVDRINKSTASIGDTVTIFEKIERDHDAGVTGGIKK